MTDARPSKLAALEQECKLDSEFRYRLLPVDRMLRVHNVNPFSVERGPTPATTCASSFVVQMLAGTDLLLTRQSANTLADHVIETSGSNV